MSGAACVGRGLRLKSHGRVRTLKCLRTSVGAPRYVSPLCETNAQEVYEDRR